jgi:hypothetical protein
MLGGKRHRNQELQTTFVELARRAERATQTRSRVEAREGMVDRFRDEMRLVRSQNGFTALFLGTIGGRRFK